MLATEKYFEKSNRTSTAIDQRTRAGDTGQIDVAACSGFGRSIWCLLYQAPTHASTVMASSAASANQARLGCPRGMMIHAASRGPMAEPALPPTWNMDCASPCRPPDARRAMREDSGWKIAEPAPMSADDASTMP